MIRTDLVARNVEKFYEELLEAGKFEGLTADYLLKYVDEYKETEDGLALTFDLIDQEIKIFIKMSLEDKLVYLMQNEYLETENEAPIDIRQDNVITTVNTLYDMRKKEIRSYFIEEQLEEIQEQVKQYLDDDSNLNKNIKDLTRIKELISELKPLVEKQRVGHGTNDLEELIYIKFELIDEIMNRVLERAKNDN